MLNNSEGKLETSDLDLDENEVSLLEEYLSDDEEESEIETKDIKFSYTFLSSYLKPYWSRINGMILLMVGDMGLNASLPIVERCLIDQGLIAKRIEIVLRSIGYFFIAFIFISILGILIDIRNSRLVSDLVSDIRKSLFSRLQMYPLGFFKKKEGGVILSRFSGDLLSVEQGLISVTYDVCIPLLEVIYSVILLFYFNVQMGFVAMLVIPLALVAPKSLAHKTFRLGYEKRKIEAKLLGSVHQNITSQAVIRAFDLGKRQFDGFSMIGRKWIDASFRFNLSGALVERTSTIGVYFLHLVIFSLGVMWVWKGKLSLGTLVAFESLFLYMGEAVTYLTESVPVLAQATGGIKHLDELFNGITEQPETKGLPDIPRIKHSIEFLGVNATYPGTRFSIKNLNLKISAGGHYAVVGESGSGKSTLFGLLLRLFDPVGGLILFDGLDIRKHTKSSLRSQCAIVFQDSLLFNMSVADNIALGKDGANQSEIESAARAAEIHDFIMQLPKGYETAVGERGEKLSGGQRQRVAIARALIRDPALLLLDEATSSLDPETEAAINKTISAISSKRTVLSVSHRISLAAKSDGVFVMKKGSLIESGTHDSLIKAGGAYAKLWKKYGQ